jgi:DNA helicase-2/ATP-dependent DNA helicase PcrA
VQGESIPARTALAAAEAPHPIVADELDLLARVTTTLEEQPEPRADSERSIVRELERLRDLLVSGRESKDAVALREQWHRNSSLLGQLRRSRQRPVVDPRSPYFAHLRLREGETERDLCLGHATRVEGGVRIVDWRNAPVSRIFYRYHLGPARPRHRRRRRLAPRGWCHAAAGG